MERTFFIGETEFKADIIDFTQNRRQAGSLSCPKCTNKPKQRYNCECGFKGTIKDYNRTSQKDVLMEQQEEILINAGIGEFKEVRTFKPLTREQYASNRYLIDHKTYLLTPQDAETSVLLRDYLQLNNKIIPIKYFRLRTTDLARNGYIESWSHFLILHILKLPSEMREFDIEINKQAIANEITSEDLKAVDGLFSSQEVTFETTDLYTTNNLIRQPKPRGIRAKPKVSLLALARRV